MFAKLSKPAGIYRPDPIGAAEAARIAFQPIVSMSSLRAHGFEALARLSDECGFASVHLLMDEAARGGMLRLAERTLLDKSIATFSQFGGAQASRLFCNVDNRVFDDPETSPGNLVASARRVGLEPANLCLELSERRPPRSVDALRRLVDVFLKHNIRIAIDDFGRGFSGLEMLMQVNPHYVKIDRAFIDGVAARPRQQAIVGKIAGLAHSLGFVVIAEGVENESDFRAARELGCDLAQGYLIARPTLNLAELELNYDRLAVHRPEDGAIPAAVDALIRKVEPLRLDDTVEIAVARFKSREVTGLIPVVDDHGYVHGAVYESDLLYFLFGDFGAALLANRGLDRSLDKVMRRCPISEATAPPEALVDSYVVAAGNEGIVLTLDGVYVGVLDNQAVLRLAAARDVAAARDQNPLTFLPGNNSIGRHLEEQLTSAAPRTLVFFDFDNFKAFNDKYGFAIGDRALLMFADLMLKCRYTHDLFVGHVGGDDFFMSVPVDLAAARVIVESLCERFRNDVESLYAAEDRAANGIWSLDRAGRKCFFPLLRASAALLPLPPSRSHLSRAAIVGTLAEGKRAAKCVNDGLAIVEVPQTAVEEQLQRLRRIG